MMGRVVTWAIDIAKYYGVLVRSLWKTFIYGQINSVDAGLGRGADYCRTGELQSDTVTSLRPGSHSYSGIVIRGEMKWAWR